MKGLQERIQMLISTKGMTNAEFAEKIGVHPSIISHISSGRNKPSLDIVDKITETFKEVRLEWLLKGKGAMTSGDYNLFEGLVEKISKTETESETKIDEALTADKSTTKLSKVSEKKSAPPEAVKIAHISQKVIEKEEIKSNLENLAQEAKEIEKKYPHKTINKSIERIVIFYEDKTFREYFPEN
jgi:transcriptional regulator with XRE-family HTH domain